MKRMKLVVIAVCLILSSCSIKKNETENTQGLKGKVKSISKATYDLKDRFGKLEKDGDRRYFTVDSFDNRGNLVSNLYELLNSYTIYKYENEKLVLESVYDTRDSSLKNKSIYEYDSVKKSTHKQNFTNDGKLNYERFLLYDKANNLINSKYIAYQLKETSNGYHSLVDTIVDIVDDPTIIEGSIESTTIYNYKYDTDGRVIETEQKSLDKSNQLDTTNYLREVYHYKDSVLIEVLSFNHAGPTTKSLYLYNNHNEVIKIEVTTINPHPYWDDFTSTTTVGIEGKTTSFTYDSNYYLVSETVYLNNKLLSVTKYEYDKVGNWIRAVKDQNGKQSMEERTILYY